MNASECKTVLFLCTGNYYRSRFAEILFNALAERHGLPWRATSRALALERGWGNVGPMAPLALQTLAAMGIDAGKQASRFPAQVSTSDLEAVELVVALKQAEHLPLVEERFPAWLERIEFWHVDDAPDALPIIEREVTALVARLPGRAHR